MVSWCILKLKTREQRAIANLHGSAVAFCYNSMDKKIHGNKGRKFSKIHKDNLKKARDEWLKENKHPWLGKKHKLDWKSKVAGGKNTQWRGNKVGYVALHSWLRRELGKPNRCDFCGRNDENQNIYEWANKSGYYLRELNDWMRLCKKCHNRYDAERKKN